MTPCRSSTFADALPDYAKDLRLNSRLHCSTTRRWATSARYGLLLACAHGSGYRPIVEPPRPRSRASCAEQFANAARGAAAVMAMNNVYYRFVHLASNPEYGTMPAKLRMNVIGVARHREGRFRAVQPRRVGA